MNEARVLQAPRVEADIVVIMRSFFLSSATQASFPLVFLYLLSSRVFVFYVYRFHPFYPLMSCGNGFPSVARRNVSGSGSQPDCSTHEHVLTHHSSCTPSPTPRPVRLKPAVRHLNSHQQTVCGCVRSRRRTEGGF